MFTDSFLNYYASLELKLTPLRKDVLYILWCAKKPLKAYEILDNLLKIKVNSNPPTVYRSLAYLTRFNIVHKIESIQSYTVCSKPEKHLISELLMVCSQCHDVIEVHDVQIQTLVKTIADNNHFVLSQDTIELKGFCGDCALNTIINDHNH